jgi:hypothetical protein
MPKEVPLFSDPDFKQNPLPIPDYEKCGNLDTPQIEPEDERHLEQFGKLLEEMKNMKTNSVNLNDEERRRNAENMIRKIAGMMDLGSSDDDESIDD